MSQNPETLLDVEIGAEFETLSGMEAGTEKYKTTVDGLTKLLDRKIEICKFESEKEEKAKDREIETSLKLAQMEGERRDRIIKNVLTGVSVIGGIMLTVWGTKASFKFEEEGTITTTVGRGFINRLLPKK